MFFTYVSRYKHTYIYNILLYPYLIQAVTTNVFSEELNQTMFKIYSFVRYNEDTKEAVAVVI